MKRILFWIFVLVVLIGLAAYFASLRRKQVRIPHYVAGAPASIPNFKFADYAWSGDAPFANDRLWFWIATTNGARCYLYDLKNRVVLGELFDAAPTGITSRDGSRLLVRGFGGEAPALEELRLFIAKLLYRRAVAGNREETFWVVDISKNVATKVGHASQVRGSGSLWHPSPDFRRAYTAPTATFGRFVVCDLENAWMSEMLVNGDPRGWWDDHRILVKSKQEQFELLDTLTQDTTPLFTRNFPPFLSPLGITNTLDLAAKPHWNGTDYDFYVSLSDKINGLHGDSFLLKVNRSGPSLSLISTNFAFRWGGSFNDTSDIYVFQGETRTPGTGGNGAVYVRNLTNGTETMIVPPDNKGQYAIPRFYGNEVIYFRDRTLHRIGLDGSNDSLLLKNAEAPNKSAQ